MNNIINCENNLIFFELFKFMTIKDQQKFISCNKKLHYI